MSAANFAPYQPPPDERQKALAESTTSRQAPPSVPHQGGKSASQQQSQQQSTIGEDSRIYDPTTAATRASLDTDFDPRYATESYQSSSPYNHSNANRVKPVWATTTSSGAGGGPASIESQYKPQPAWSQNGTGAGLGSNHSNRPDHLSYSTSQGWNLSNLCFASWILPPFTSVLLLIWETENDLVRFHAYQAGLFGVAIVLVLWILRSWFGWYSLSIIFGMGSLGYSWVCG